MEENGQIPSVPPDADLPSNLEGAGNLPPVEMEVKVFAIAGFWRRVLAIVLDIAILAIPLIILGFAFEGLAFSLGPWGRLIGYGIMFLYWGCLTSKIGKGQTLGKKIMKITVVGRQGDYLPVGKALLRSLVLVLPGLLNGWVVPFGQNPIYILIASTILVGGGLAIFYGIFFNRKTRQGIHDLLVGSYVVKAVPEPGTMAPENRRIHTWMNYGMLGLGLVWGIVNAFLPPNTSAMGVMEPGDWQQITEMQSTLLQSGEFFTVSIGRYNSWMSDPGGKTITHKDLTFKIWVKKSCQQDPAYCQDVAMRSARLALDRFDHINNLTGMRISVYNAFDLGLASGNYTTGINWSIDDWRKNLAQ